MKNNKLTDEELRIAKIDKLANDEIFVLLKYKNYERNYWISNYGRLINNLKGYLYLHKQTISSDGKHVHWKIYSFKDDGSKNIYDELADKLMKEIFFIKNEDRNKLYFIDGNPLNLYYKNMIYCTDYEYKELISKNINIDDLEYTQKYVDFNIFNNTTLLQDKTRDNNTLKYEEELVKLAKQRYNSMMNRCYGNKGTLQQENTYGDCYVCLSWRKDKQKFIDWFILNYYEIDGSYNMNLDKDILVKGNKIYSPKTCCIVPNNINTIISTTHKSLNNKSKLPIGVKYDKTRNKYYSTISNIFYEQHNNYILNNKITLPYRKTPEEAFYDYKKHKEAQIILLADKYIDKLPKKVYEALISWNIEITE